MIEYKNVKIFTDNIEQQALQQIYTLQKTELFGDRPIRIMPDVHAGAGCVIGFTAEYTDKIVPNLIGVDIGCGMLVVKLGKVEIDLEKLDKVIKKNVPAGREVCAKGDKYCEDSKVNLRQLLVYDQLRNKEWLEASIGTLGGGNHFIELDVDEEDNKYLVIHSGSRNLGKQVAEIYQHLAIKTVNNHREERTKIVEQLKAQGKAQEIQQALANFKSANPKIPDDLCYLEGQQCSDYLHDMALCQKFATYNREAMAEKILVGLRLNKLKSYKHFHTVHNYIDIGNNLIRKGAVAAYEGQELLIPLNMRDGSILAVGKGNTDWNCSAPHGAGRIMSRSQAKKQLSLEEYTQSMEGIYTTTADLSTIDEAPQAYKPAQEIIDAVAETVDIISIIKPVYNFKASED